MIWSESRVVKQAVLLCCSFMEDVVNLNIGIVSIILACLVVILGLLLCLTVFIIIIWYHDLYQPRYIHQANVLLASFFSLFTFGILFVGLPEFHSSGTKCKFQ